MIVTVVEHSTAWSNKFAIESKELTTQIGEIINQIHHIGSTAVPGLKAKPIIDIILDVKSLTGLDLNNSKLEQLGYEAMGELGIKGRRYFRKGGDNRTHQIHAFQSGDPNIIRHIAFRDYLIEHDEIAKKYGELKFAIAQRCNNDIEQYCDEKNAFVKHYEGVALEWYKNRS